MTSVQTARGFVHPSIVRLPLLLIFSMTSPGAIPSTLTPSECLVQLDAAVNLALESDLDAATEQLETLATACEHIPQIQHNLGVLAAMDNRLPEAISYLEASVAADPRAALSVRHLQDIFRYRASVAYANALNTTPTASEPDYSFQDSSDLNSDSLRLQRERSELHTVGTIEYELFAWWQIRHDERQDVREHYVSDYPEVSILQASERFKDIDWDDMQREIAFTQEDAVIVLSDVSVDDASDKTLILMRLEGNRWKIYQETSL